MAHDLIMPDLGLADRPVTASQWLVELGSEVAEGDRLLEVQAEGVTVDLPAPVSGRVVEILAGEDELLVPGQRLAVIEPSVEAT